MEWSESDRALWCAVILQAFLDVTGVNYDVRRKKDYRNVYAELALAWLCSDRQDAGSFRWICDVLNLNSSYLLNGLWKSSDGLGRFYKGVL